MVTSGTASIAETPTDPTAVGCIPSGVTVSGTLVSLCLTVDDGPLAHHLGALSAAERIAAVERVLGVGVRGVETMGVGVSVAEVSAEVSRVLAEATEDTERRVAQILDESRRSVAASLDPAQRDSITWRAISEVQAAHADLLGRLDPDNAGGHTGRLVARLGELLGPEGPLEERLTAALDADADGSSLGRLRQTFDGRFQELRDLLVGDAARRIESQRGTAKGIDFEDSVEGALRREAGRLGGATVECTTTASGALGPDCRVGDFVITLASGRSIVVEAKNAATLALRGRGGVLDELERAKANRKADFAVCVSAQDAFPAEVGCFGVFADRVLVVDDGDGTLLAAAIRWAAATLDGTNGASGDAIDVSAATDHLRRIRDLAARVSNARRSLSSIRTGVDQVHKDLEDLRSELLDHVDDAIRALRPASAPIVMDQTRANRSSPGSSGPTRLAISSKSSYG